MLPTALCIHLCGHDSSDAQAASVTCITTPGVEPASIDRSFKVDPSLLGGGENLRLSRSVSVAEQKL